MEEMILLECFDLCLVLLLTVSTWLRSQWRLVTCTKKALSTGTWSLRTSCSTTMVQKFQESLTKDSLEKLQLDTCSLPNLLFVWGIVFFHVLASPPFPSRTCKVDRLRSMQRVHPWRNGHPHLLWHYRIHVGHTTSRQIFRWIQCSAPALSCCPFPPLPQGSRDPNEERT